MPMFLKITNNMPNKNRIAETTFYLTYNNGNIADVVKTYTKIEGTAEPKVNEPITIGKYTFEIVTDYDRS